eukprot:ctg_3212.g580
MTDRARRRTLRRRPLAAAGSAVPPGAPHRPFGPPLPPDARPPTAGPSAPRRDYGDLDPPPPDTMYM